MDSKGTDDKKSVSMSRAMLSKLLTLTQETNTAISKLQASGSSASTLHDLQNLSNQLQKLVATTKENSQNPSKELPQIRDDLDKVFVVEEVGHSCDLCHRDLATDPQRPNASTLSSLQEACVLSCGHVYHFKCLSGTTLDLDNHSTDPSCILCIS